jgi:molybdopterin-synthase adenylyltransferase
MRDEQLLRYARHVLLPQVGVEGQERLLAAHALVIGAGGLGSPVALYLGSAGVGTLTLVDDDVVDLTNLQRQIVHRLDRVGMAKVDSAAQTVAAIDPGVRVNAVQARADAVLLNEWVPKADVVLDCSDNFATRQTVNAACVRHAKPLVWGAAVAWSGQVSLFDPHQPNSPCYACLFPPHAVLSEVRCATMGVFAPLVGVIGSFQAALALQCLMGLSAPTSSQALQMFDAQRMEWTCMTTAQQVGCGVCGPVGAAHKRPFFHTSHDL